MQIRLTSGSPVTAWIRRRLALLASVGSRLSSTTRLICGLAASPQISSVYSPPAVKLGAGVGKGTLTSAAPDTMATISGLPAGTSA